MRDLRTRLERLGERAKAAPDAFERLDRARRRHERNRRIAAGVVALLVAGAGSFAAFTALRDSNGRVAGGSGEAFLAIWPESTREEAAAVQELVDAGDPNLAWRLDADETALAFARDALGWTDATAEVGLDDASRSVVVRTPRSCPTPPIPGCPFPREATVELSQLDGPNGIWSVVSARSPQFTEMPSAGTEIVAGDDLVLREAFPARSGAFYASFVGLGPCAGWEYDVLTPPGEIALTVPTPPVDQPNGCPVALLILRTDPADHSLQEMGQLLLAYGFRTALYHVLALPLRLVPPAGPVTVPDVANVTCDGSDIAVDTGQVLTQRDGVHLSFGARSETMFSLVGNDASIDYALGPGIGSGDELVLSQLAPGSYRLSCRPIPNDGQASGEAVPLEVLDEGGFYVPTALDCPGASYDLQGTFDSVETGSPIEIARASLTGLEPADVVERAGYLAATAPEVRIVRDGSTVGVVAFGGTSGAWWMATITGCQGTSFGWSGGVVGAPSGPTPIESPGPGSAWDALCSAARAGGGNNVHNGVDVHVDGRDLDFDTGCLIAPAGEPLTILFSNLDDGVPRNIAIYRMTPFLRECLVTGTSPTSSDDLRRPLFSGELITGVDEMVYELGSLEPGEYYFQDDVHPSANGVLVIG